MAEVQKPGQADVRGELQAEVMAAVWELGEATVEEVRSGQAEGRRSAYTTIQTIMTRLAERGLLVREQRGRAYVYRARYAESEQIARVISERLTDASPDTRKKALVTLVDLLEGEQLDEVVRYATDVQRLRSEKKNGS